MSWDHDRVEALLAARALGGLDDDDEGLVERAVAEHLPGCARCRAADRAFRDVAADLGLWTAPAAPPDVAGARLRRAAAPRHGPARARWAVAGVAALVLGALSLWNLTLAGRVSEAEARQRWLMDAVATLGSPHASVVPLSSGAGARIHVLYAHDSRRMYLVASGVRPPRRGVYQVWLVGARGPRKAGAFVPRDGVAMLPMDEDPATLQEIVITDEVSDEAPTPAGSPLAHADMAGSPSPTPTPVPTATPTG